MLARTNYYRGVSLVPWSIYVQIQTELFVNITTIMVTHDESLAKYATRAIHLDSGKVKSDEQVV